MPGLQHIIVLLSALLFVANALGAGFDETKFQLNTSQSNVSEGFLTLSWSGPQDSLTALELVITKDSQHSVIHQIINPGTEPAVHLSGFSNGEYYAFMRDASGATASNTVAFVVQHRDLSTALLLFFLGLIMFLALAALIFNFSRSQP